MLILELSLLILLLLVFIVVYIPRVIKAILTNQAPFIPTKRRALPYIVEALDLQESSVLYDLGCGDGRILKAAIADGIKKGLHVSGIGIDNDWVPALLAKIKTKKLPITIKQGTIDQFNLGDATHIYVYLLPSMLLEVEQQIREQCKQGTKIVACDFQFPSLYKEKEVAIPGKRLLSRTLYIYTV